MSEQIQDPKIPDLPKPKKRTRWVKGVCQDCIRYHDCPRMKHGGDCYNMIEVEIEIEAPPSKPNDGNHTR